MFFIIDFTVKPKCLYNSLAGAEAPKLFTPKKASFGPINFSQGCDIPASIKILGTFPSKFSSKVPKLLLLVYLL